MGGFKPQPTDALSLIPVFGIPLAIGARLLFPHQLGGGSHPQVRASVSDTDLARARQGGKLTIGSTNPRTKEGALVSSLGMSGLRIPTGGQ